MERECLKRSVTKRILFLLLFIGVSISLSGCLEGVNLNDDERLLFEIIVEDSKSFKNPSSVKILRAYEMLENEDLNFRVIELQAENSYGAKVKSSYFAFYETGKEGLENYLMAIDEDNIDTMIELNEDVIIDTAKINKAILEYWKEKGII